MRRMCAFVLLFLLAGCSDSTAPEPGVMTAAPFDGSFDPAGGTFVLERAEVTVPGQIPVPVELVGSNLTVDSRTERVEIDVALRNVGQQSLYPPAIVWVSDFVPNSVRVTNANLALPNPTLDVFGFDYTRLLGPGEVLAPGETSESYRWRLYDPGLVSFSFVAEVEMASEAPPAFISGGVFADANLDGIRQRNEGPWPYGFMHLVRPDGSRDAAYCDDNGAFRFIVSEPGLYQLRLESLVDCIVCFTTPNPLEVMIVEEADGSLGSFGMAVFGALCGPCAAGE